MAGTLLELKGVSKSFGGLRRIHELDLHVDGGEIVSVIGPNGAGKTTLFNLVTGVYPPDAGEIDFEGQSILGLDPHEITELIARLRNEGGYTILVIEHDMHVVEGISDRVVALDHGVKIAEGTFEQVATDPRVVEAYLGTKAAATK